MHNNLIYLTDGRGKTDAAEMTDSDWDQLVVDNRNSTRRRLVKCAWCWDDDQITHWMKTYNNAHGKRVVSHQPGEAGNHPYQALESDEHKAYCDRVERVGTEEGYPARREARAADGRTRSDVLLLGTRHVAYEMQHSPFKTGYGATERTRKSLAAKRDAVAWHTDSGIIAGAARVAMLRSNQAQLPQIENPRYQIRILGGFRQIVIWTCTAREGYRCPNGRFSGCGQTHLDTAPTGITLDDFIRQAPAGTLLPVLPLQRRGFWTTAVDYQRWTDYNAGRPVLDVDPPESPDRPTQEGYGHSRPASVKNHLPSVPPQRTMQSFASARTCEAGRTPCGQPARPYAAGWRCEEHRPSSR